MVPGMACFAVARMHALLGDLTDFCRMPTMLAVVAVASMASKSTDGRRLAMAPNFFQSKRQSTHGKRHCPAPAWKAHGFGGHATCGACSSHIEMMRSTACAADVVTDKVEAHSYHTMYGVFLLPLRDAPHRVKMLEIGLGCDMHYEPGASASLWPKLLPDAEVWMAEHDAACVQESVRRGWLPGIHTLTGDQSEPAVTQRWIRESGGSFDAVIDDGGHSNWQIRSAFSVLWPAVRPGGFYFIEDMHPGRNAGWPQTTPKDREAVMSDIIQAWIEQLTIDPPSWKASARRHPLPADVAFIACQREACVIAKACAGIEEGPHNRYRLRHLGNATFGAHSSRREHGRFDDTHAAARSHNHPSHHKSGGREQIAAADQACVPSEWSSASALKSCGEWMRSGGGSSNAPKSSELYHNTPLWSNPSGPIPHIDSVVLRPLKPSARLNRTSLYVYAMCEATSYALDIDRHNLEHIRMHHPEAIIIMATCGESKLPDDILAASDAVLQARCASSRGYDSGMWQQAIRYALKVLDWAALQSVYMFNDSVLGPMYRMELKPGLNAAAVWSGHIASSSVHAYLGPVLQSPTFIEYWNQTDFSCGKIGSMVLLEKVLYDRYKNAGFDCWTYTNNIDEFQSPKTYSNAIDELERYPDASAAHPLPFYKHKNRPFLSIQYAKSGRAAFDSFAWRVGYSNTRKPTPLIRCTVRP
jgi:hypothetical protein